MANEREKMKVIIVEDWLHRAGKVADRLMSDGIDAKVLLFKDEAEYEEEKLEFASSFEEYGHLAERVDFWSLFDRLEELSKDGENVFLLDYELIGDGSRYRLQNSLSVIYMRETQSKGRCFTYAQEGTESYRKLSEMFPGHVIGFGSVGNMDLKYGENEEFCRLVRKNKET